MLNSGDLKDTSVIPLVNYLVYCVIDIFDRANGQDHEQKRFLNHDQDNDHEENSSWNWRSRSILYTTL